MADLVRKVEGDQESQGSQREWPKNEQTTQLAECQQRKRNNYSRQNTEWKRATDKATKKYLVAIH